MNITQLEEVLAEIAARTDLASDWRYVYAEVGRYKPFSMSTILAAQRRGYRVERVRGGCQVYYIYPKEIT